jgi:cholesterol oxidase
MSADVTYRDVVVVGSGFGGSFAARALAESGHHVCVLERGRRWKPGDFPRRPDELFANTWDPRSARFGLYDLRSFRGLNAVLAAGVGGGSLIYSNVLLKKPDEWFITPVDKGESVDWPITGSDLAGHYDDARKLLEPMRFLHPPELAPRTAAFERAARAKGYDFIKPELAVTFSDECGTMPGGQPIPSPKGVTRRTCTLCGECIIGCNVGAKNTLDLTVLRHGRIEVSERKLVRCVTPVQGDGPFKFAVRYVDLDGRDRAPLQEQRGQLREMRCKVLILAAGSLGSTELMLRSAASFPGLSRQVGAGFSPNGDLLTFGSRVGRRRGREFVDDTAQMAQGPSITRAVRVDDASGARFYVQDSGLPDQLAWLLFGIPSRSLIWRGGRALGRRVLELLGRDPRTRVGGDVSEALARSRTSRAIAILGMGVDTANGRMSLREDQLQLNWTVRRSRELLRKIEGTSDDIIRTLGGRTWPTTLTSLGRIITVHPVGGLPMGTSAATGVVDDHGEVFGWHGLFVTDGAALPGAVGPNPALTIAACALRAAERIDERLNEAA